MQIPIFGLKAFGFLSSDALIALERSTSCSKLLWQDLQLQSLQNSPFAKHSQYNFKHMDFVQLHGFLLPIPAGFLKIISEKIKAIQ